MPIFDFRYVGNGRWIACFLNPANYRTDEETDGNAGWYGDTTVAVIRNPYRGK
jgi:hypothetical protein